MNTTSMLRASGRYWWYRNGSRAGPAWLQYVWTMMFSSALAVGFTVLGFLKFGSGDGAWRNLDGWWYWYQRNWVVSICVGYAIHLLFDLGWLVLGQARIKRLSAPWRVLFFAGIPMLGVVLAWPLGLELTGVGFRRLLSAENANTVAGSFLFSLLMTFVFYQFFAVKARQIKAERAATEARLKLLQAQIEPHFMFNTLANVAGLMDVDAARARAMLESFIDYLRSSLGNMRRARNTLGDEVDLIDAYMRIIQFRMEDRLGYQIDVPEALRHLALPALTLQPLVENAIVHGLEPKIEGGSVRIAARLESDMLVLTVDDDGLGLAAAPSALRRPGSGTALRNIRERLVESHGQRAALQIAAALPQGVRATLTLPLMTEPA